MGNIKATLQGGLQNDYGIFNLNADMLHYIKVDIITNGGQYVESLEADFLHGSTNGLRDHEGIKPIDFAAPNWDTYGPVLATKLTNYFADRINSMATQELWENYSVYGNQFSLEFDIIEGLDDSTYQNVNFSYPSYSNENIDFNGRKYRTYTLSTLYSSGVEMKAYIIHFSKYYYVYNTVSGSQLTLRPLLYYAEDLDTYNMGIYELTESGSTDSIGIPYVKTLLGIEWYRHKSGWHRCEEIFHSVRSFDTTARVNAAGTGAITGGYGAWNKFCSDEESSGNGHDWSMFASNPADRPTFENYSAKLWASIPEGFSLWGLGGGHEYYINNKNEGHLDDTTKLPNSYTSVFNPLSVKRRRTSREGGHVHGSSGGNDSFIGVMFRLDKNSNHHIFNTYFPVWGNDFNNGNISQVIKYKGSNSSYPKYVGMILASILTSIYVYGDEPSGTIKYVQDVVYLLDHSTIYTKDVVYRAYVEFGQGSANTSNDLLLMHKSNYKEYVERLKTFITTSEDDPNNYDDPDKVFNDNNVNLELKECIKNVPILFKLNYIQPELNIIGEKSSVKILDIDGTSTDCISQGVKPNLLYYIDDNGQIIYFNKLFRIKWLKSLKIQDDRLIGVYDSTKAPTDNPYLYKSINFDEGKLGFETFKLTSYTNGQCYCIHSYNDSYGNNYHDLLINDILLPAAKIS